MDSTSIVICCGLAFLLLYGWLISFAVDLGGIKYHLRRIADALDKEKP